MFALTNFSAGKAIKASASACSTSFSTGTPARSDGSAKCPTGPDERRCSPLDGSAIGRNHAGPDGGGNAGRGRVTEAALSDPGGFAAWRRCPALSGRRSSGHAGVRLGDGHGAGRRGFAPQRPLEQLVEVRHVFRRRSRGGGRHRAPRGPPSRSAGAGGRGPARNGVRARTLSWTPATGSTCPSRVIAPVMARPAFTGRPVNAETSAATMATPADAPSLGAPPESTCRWTSVRRGKDGSRPQRRAFGPQPGEGGARGHLHGLALAAGQGQPAAARHRGGLDEEEVAAARRLDQPDGDAGPTGAVSDRRAGRLRCAKHLDHGVRRDLDRSLVADSATQKLRHKRASAPSRPHTAGWRE